MPWDETRVDSCDPYLKIHESVFVESSTETAFCPKSVNPSWPEGTKPIILSARCSTFSHRSPYHLVNSPRVPFR